MTREERTELRALCDKATPGPWKFDDRWKKCVAVYAGDWINSFQEGRGRIIFSGSVFAEDFDENEELNLMRVTGQLLADGEFIAVAREAVPALLDALEKAEEESAMLREDVQRWCETCIHRKEKLNPFKDVNYCQECQNSREPVYRNWKWWGDERIEESK